MKLALWQTEGVTGDPASNIARLEQIATSAAADGVELLLCPELYLTGYNAPDAITATAEPAGGPSFQQIAALCARLNIAIAYGYAERDPGKQRIYNAAVLIGPNGESLLQFRKAHLFGAMERSLFTPGTTLGAPARLGNWKPALLICYDIEFPESARTLALKGADLLLVPTALPHGAAYVPQHIISARAAENGLFVAYCNRSGAEAGLHYAGSSRIAAPDGSLVASAGEESALLVADINRAHCDAAPYLTDRRPELYGG